MTDTARRLLEAVLALPEEDREDLVAELLAHLPEDWAASLDPRWLTREPARELRAEPWEAVEARILARLPRG